MYTSCRFTEYCFKCDISNVLVYFKGQPIRTRYLCGKCQHPNPISHKNQTYQKQYKFQNK
jgi:hypothetical protein